MKTKNLPPFAPTLIESTRAIGYSLEAAIADIIDNSIAAGATEVNVFFYPIDGAYISILDNGIGMDETRLDIAMQYGSQNPIDKRDAKDLGRFGLGLKTASLSQCRSLTVVTKQGKSISGRRWDIDHVSKVGDWSLLILDKDDLVYIPEIDRLMALPSGTLVVWQNLDRLIAGESNFRSALGRKIDIARTHLALVYHRYLKGESGIARLKIAVNGETISPVDPFLQEKSTRPMDDEVLNIDEEKIIVRPYILPHLSRMTPEELKSLGGEEGLRRQQGFYIYRNKRLLKWGTWFRMIRQGELSKLARIQVDIPNTLDALWTLDIKKSSALPPATVQEKLKAVIKQIAEKSKRIWTVRGKREINDTTVHVWNRMKNQQDGIYYEVNREHPMIKQLTDNFPSLRKPLFSLFQQIELGLPLNQLYVDLSNDEQLINAREQSEQDISASLSTMLSSCNTIAEKHAFLDAISNIEPYSSYPETLKNIKRMLADG